MNYTSVLELPVTLTSLFSMAYQLLQVISISPVHNSKFLVCNILLNLYFVHVLCCICQFYLLAMSGFSARLVNVQFLLSSLVVLNGQFSVTIHYKKLLLSRKNICRAGYLCSCNLFVQFFKGSESYFNFSHTYSSLHSSISVIEKKMIILLYFEFTQNLVFTNCPTVMLNIRDSSIKKRC